MYPTRLPKEILMAGSTSAALISCGPGIRSTFLFSKRMTPASRPGRGASWWGSMEREHTFTPDCPSFVNYQRELREPIGYLQTWSALKTERWFFHSVLVVNLSHDLPWFSGDDPLPLHLFLCPGAAFP